MRIHAGSNQIKQLAVYGMVMVVLWLWGAIAFAATITIDPTPPIAGQPISFTANDINATACGGATPYFEWVVVDTSSTSFIYSDTTEIPSITTTISREGRLNVNVAIYCRPPSTEGGALLVDSGSRDFIVVPPLCDWSANPNPITDEKKAGEVFTQQVTITDNGYCSASTFTASAEKGQINGNSSPFEYTLNIPPNATGRVTDTITVASRCPAGASSSRAACDDSIQIPVDITIEAPPLSATITEPTTTCTGRPGQAISFVGQAEGGVPPYSYQWESQGQVFGTTANASQIFTAEGTYRVTFTVMDSASQTALPASVNCTIMADALTVTAQSTSPLPYVTGNVINFQGNATGGTAPLTYAWTYIRDGGVPQPFGSNVDNASLTPDQPGQYAVVLTVTDSMRPNPQIIPSTPISFTVDQARPDNATLQKEQGSDSASTNATVPFSVRVRVDGQPTPNIDVVWRVTPADASGRLLNDQDQLVTTFTTTTDGSGVARARFSTGNQLLRYRIAALVDTTAGTANQAFDIAVGIAPLVGGETTPEKAMALYTDQACQNNRGRSPTLSELCNQLGKATPEEVNTTMNQLTPRNAPDAANTNQSMAKGQARNVLSRLAALRRGASGISVSGLAINQNGQSLPTDALTSALRGARGGAAGDEPGTELDGRLGIFINGTIDRGDKSQTSQEEGFDYRFYNITGGMDYRFTNQFVAGFALGYSSSNADLDNSGGDMDATGYSLAAYANYFINENAFLDGMLMYGKGSFDMKRNIDYVITGQQYTANSSPDSKQWGARIGGGYDFKFDQGIQATVGGHLNYLKANLESFDENGAEGNGLDLNLHVEETSLKSFTFGLSGELSRTFSMSWGVLTPLVRAEWIHEFEDGAVPISGWYLNDPSSPSFGGTNAFVYQSDKQDPNYFLLGLGASAVFSNGMQSFLYYQATVGKENYTDNLITGGIRFEF